MKHKIRFKINGKNITLEIKSNELLLDLLRNRLGLKGTKKGCGTGECGACTVLVNGEPVNSCILLAIKVDGKEITTIEDLKKEGSLSKLQKAFIKYGALQCGFCGPGMLMSAKALLDRNPNPSKEEIKVALSGNLCRCTGYAKIIEAIQNVNKN